MTSKLLVALLSVLLLTVPAQGQVIYHTNPFNGERVISSSDATAIQALAGDLTLGAGYGSNTATAPVYAGGVMGNVLGANLTRTENIIGGVIGKYDITGTNASTKGKAAVIGTIGDQASSADAAFLAILGGDTGVSTPGAAFGVMSQNSTGGSKFSYGLDLYRAAIGAYRPVTYGSAAIRVPNNSWIVARNAAGSADVNLLQLTAANQLVLDSPCFDAANQDVCLTRDAANVLAQRNGATSQTSRLYEIWTDAANYSRLNFRFSTDTFFIDTQAAGTGTARALQIGTTSDASVGLRTNGVVRWVLDGGTAFTWYPNNDTGLADLGKSSARLGTGYFQTGLQLSSASNGAAMGWARVTTTVPTINLAATITATNLIPAGTVVYSCVTYNTVAFNGTMTSFSIGDGVTANLFANNAALTAGSTTTLANHLSTFKPTLYTAANNVVVTANGGTFGTTGTIRITCFYYDSTAPTS